MKFAKELEQDLVPEWRIKYLNYKAGKKYVKGVARAINRANTTPRLVGRRSDTLPRDAHPHGPSPLTHRSNTVETTGNKSGNEDVSGSKPVSGRRPLSPTYTERQSLTRSPGNEGNYGSFVHSPPKPSPTATRDRSSTFELPDPAIKVPSNAHEHHHGPLDALRQAEGRMAVRRSMSTDSPAQNTGSATLPRLSTASQMSASPHGLRRLFSHGQQLSRTETSRAGYGMQALDTVRQREKEFFDFLDSELDKVETFFRQKEDLAGQHLKALREQLHEMRYRRSQEMRWRKEQENGHSHNSHGKASGFEGHQNWIDPIKNRIFKPGENSKALSLMPQTPIAGASGRDGRSDYIRRPQEDDVPYRTAKRKLKLALQEFYRGLELLKSYAILNRTAFRKLNKKYDKAVNARPPYRYMNEKVNKAWFVNSDVVDSHIRAVEGLYADYFEKGNHKIAAGKLRRLNRRPGDESGIAFRNGLFIGIGTVFTIEGLVYGAELLFSPDPVIQQQASYLMQIYGGYFLMIFLFALFCLNCYVWTANKINYPFIFEFDTRHSLDWRQLASFPSFFLMLFGVFFWVNFTRYGTDELWLYYPVILIVVSLAIIFLPAPILWHRSRQWFVYSHYRLFFAGLYPVEFRDVFLGDVYCSLTYTTANIELFFCLYAHFWGNPSQCNSSSSRLMGFFAALPPIWRALQCIRRYRDTRNVFPHLVNCGKYGMTIMSAVTLSLYRIHGSHTNLALFIAFSTVNSIYTSIWDLFMDFSLLQQDARYRYLRDILGLKRRWLYYAIMVIDPLLRFSWIFYAIFTYDKQHSTFVSFLVALGEATRRGMWALFRVENEHCSNVAQYKASRELRLPYNLEHDPLVEEVTDDETPESSQRKSRASTIDVDAAGAAARSHEHAVPDTAQAHGSPSREDGVRRRRGFSMKRAKSIWGIMADAHKQDFEKKRRPAAEGHDDIAEESADEIKSEDDDDDDTGSMLEERMEVRRAEGLVRGNSSEDERD